MIHKIKSTRKNSYEKLLQKLTENNFKAKEISCFSFLNKSYIIDKKKAKSFETITESYYSFFIEKSFLSALLGIGMGIILSSQMPKFIPEPIIESKTIATPPPSKNLQNTNTNIPEYTSIYQEELERIEIYNQYLDEYCDYFNLNNKKVKNLAMQLTNNYINNIQSLINEEDLHQETIEGNCMLFTYLLYRKINMNPAEKRLNINWEELDILPESLKTNTPIRHIPQKNIETITLENGYRVTEYFGKVASLFNMDKNHLLTICYVETGGMLKKSAINGNNFVGMKPDGPNGKFLEFPSPEAGIISAHGNVLLFYGEVKTIEEFANKYSTGNIKKKNEETEGWLKNYKSIRKRIENNESYYFGSQVQEEVYQHILQPK